MNHQYKRYNKTMYNNTLGEKLPIIPKVHLGKKHPIIKLKMILE